MSAKVKSSVVLLELVAVALSTWAFLKYDGASHVQTILSLILKSGPSDLPFTIFGVLGASLASVPLLRRSRKMRTHRIMRSSSGPDDTWVHPLMLTPRPSRDQNFVIRKTKKRGRISRNRSGERLPANQPE